jgi:hypothetical protein
MRNSLSARVVAVAMLAMFGTSTLFAQGQTINVQLWADNWFEFYADGEMIMTDPVPFMTEQSFNAEVFSFEATRPVQIAVIVKDFSENDSGFEYIGSRRQQMGDGGFIAEFRDASNDLIASTSNEWVCQVIHQAPLNPSCANDIQSCQANILPEPAGWTSADFDDSDWPNAVVHSIRSVRPHGGYSSYSWDSASSLIWGDDLEIDNTLLCRFTLN